MYVQIIITKHLHVRSSYTFFKDIFLEMNKTMKFSLTLDFIRFFVYNYIVFGSTPLLYTYRKKVYFIFKIQAQLKCIVDFDFVILLFGVDYRQSSLAKLKYRNEEKFIHVVYFFPFNCSILGSCKFIL